jgi:maltooligosyltrehalose trehalohydrolase
MKIGAALILTSPYIPMLFQGEEWRSNSPFLYFVDFNDEPELAQAVSEGRCREFAAFGWDPEAIPNPNEVATFLESKLNWDELNQAEHREMFDWYKSLIALRRSVSALTTGRLDLTMAKFDAEAGWLYVERGIVRIVCNFSHRANEMPCLSRELSCVLLSSKPGCWPRKASVNMPPDSVAILGPKALRQWSDVAPRRLAFSTSKSAHVQDAR